jgi:hypothetical protein
MTWLYYAVIWLPGEGREAPLVESLSESREGARKKVEKSRFEVRRIVRIANNGRFGHLALK